MVERCNRRPILLISTSWHFKFTKFGPLWKRLGSNICRIESWNPLNLISGHQIGTCLNWGNLHKDENQCIEFQLYVQSTFAPILQPLDPKFLRPPRLSLHRRVLPYDQIVHILLVWYDRSNSEKLKKRHKLIFEVFFFIIAFLSLCFRSRTRYSKHNLKWAETVF